MYKREISIFPARPEFRLPRLACGTDHAASLIVYGVPSEATALELLITLAGATEAYAFEGTADASESGKWTFSIGEGYLTVAGDARYELNFSTADAERYWAAEGLWTIISATDEGIVVQPEDVESKRYAVTSVNGVAATADNAGAIEIDVGGTVKTVENVGPDADGNVDLPEYDGTYEPAAGAGLNLLNGEEEAVDTLSDVQERVKTLWQLLGGTLAAVALAVIPARGALVTDELLADLDIGSARVITALPENADFRTDVWGLKVGYAPSTETIETIGETNRYGMVVVTDETTIISEGRYAVTPAYISENAAAVTLTNVTVSGYASVEQGTNGTWYVTGQEATNVLVEVTGHAAGGASRVRAVRLSSRSVTTTTEAEYYSDDADSISTFRSTVNDLALAGITFITSNGTSTVTDSSTVIFTSSYFRDADGAEAAGYADVFPFLRSNVYRNTGAALKRGADGGSNTGSGASFVVGKRLVGNASHWWNSSYTGRVFYVEQSDGTTQALTLTGKQVDLCDWATDKWGKDGFQSKFGFPVSYLYDIRVMEVAEDIPDECLPALLPTAVATTLVETNGTALVANMLAWTLGQNNALYPVCFTNWRVFGGTYEEADTTHRKDLADAATAYGYNWWTVRSGESGRPVFIHDGEHFILVGDYQTTGGGGSWIAAADVLPYLEEEWGRDGAETLNILTAEDMASFIVNE